MPEKRKIEITNIPMDGDKYYILLGKIVNAIDESGLDANFKNIKQDEEVIGKVLEIIDTK